MELTPKQARVLKGFSQSYVAHELKVHRHTYMKWEKQPDEMPIGKAKEFSVIIGIPIDVIFFGSDSTLSGIEVETC